MKSKWHVSLTAAVICCTTLTAQVSEEKFQHYRYENSRFVQLITLYPNSTYSFSRYSKSAQREWNDTGKFTLRKRDQKIKFKSARKTSFSSQVADMDLYLNNNCITDGNKLILEKLVYRYRVTPFTQEKSKEATCNIPDEKAWRSKVILSNEDAVMKGSRAADSMAKASLSYRKPKDEEQKWLQSQTDSICKPWHSDSLKFVAICKYVMTRLEYDYTFKKSVEAYDALMDGKTVCAGYAAIMEILCRNAGIPCAYVVGHAMDETYKWEYNFRRKHAWNIVKLNNRWYMTDVTWMDGYFKKGIIPKNMPYYLVKPEVMAHTHMPDVFDLTFSPFYGNGVTDYLKNPLTRSGSDNLQLLEPTQNIIMAGSKKKQVVIYAKSADTVYLHSDQDHLMPKRVYYLSPGFNIIPFDAQNVNSRHYLNSGSFDAAFLVVDPNPKNRYRHFMESFRTDKYDSLFYAVMLQLLDSTTLPLEKNASEKDTAAWRSLLREYDGRYADCAFSISFSADYSNPKGKSTTDYNIRYTFTGAKINGKKAILEIPLKCDDNTDHVAAVNKKLFKQPVLKASNW